MKNFSKLATIFALCAILIASVSTVSLASTLASTASSIEESKNSFSTVSISEYNQMSSKKQENYLCEYSKTLEDNINRQIKEINDNFIKELSNKQEFNKAAQLSKAVESLSVTINSKDPKIKSKLEQSFSEPVTLDGLIPITDVTTRSVTHTYTDYGFFIYNTRSISHALYTDCVSDNGYTANGDRYDSYDVTSYIYSWSGNSTYDDRVVRVGHGVCHQAPSGYGPYYYSGTYSDTTGFPAHHYSDSLYRTVNLAPGLHLTATAFGGASNVACAEAVFGGGIDTQTKGVRNDFGATLINITTFFPW